VGGWVGASKSRCYSFVVKASEKIMTSLALLMGPVFQLARSLSYPAGDGGIARPSDHDLLWSFGECEGVSLDYSLLSVWDVQEVLGVQGGWCIFDSDQLRVHTLIAVPVLIWTDSVSLMCCEHWIRDRWSN